MMKRYVWIPVVSALLWAVALRPASAAPADWWDVGWVNRVDVTVTEPGVADRFDEYIDVVIDFPAGSYTSLEAEIRVIDDAGAELPSLVHSQMGDQAHVLLSKTVLQDEVATVFVYWGNGAASVPAYAFVDLPVIFYVEDVDVQWLFETNTEVNFESLSPFGQLGIAVELADGDADYDSASAMAQRFVLVTARCTIVEALAATAIYSDASIWGVSHGDCLEDHIFGLGNVNDVPGNAVVPAVTDYITQDYAPNTTLSFTAEEYVTDPGGVVELFDGADPGRGPLARWDGGHTLPNGHTLAYRSFYSGLTTIFDVDATVVHTRAVEFLLQENRVDTLLGTIENVDDGEDTTAGDAGTLDDGTASGTSMADGTASGTSMADGAGTDGGSASTDGGATGGDSLGGSSRGGPDSGGCGCSEGGLGASSGGGTGMGSGGSRPANGSAGSAGCGCRVAPDRMIATTAALLIFGCAGIRRRHSRALQRKASVCENRRRCSARFSSQR